MKIKPKVLALIPARSGSKSIPDKNIRDVAGKPMMAWSIQQALDANLVQRVIVSTDSEEYARLARKFGAEVPFIRPKEISADNSTDLETFVHALNWLNENDNYIPDICLHLRPTHPLRDVSDIDTIIEILSANKELDSVRTIFPSEQTPYKMWTCDKSSILSPVSTVEDFQEAWNEPRQKLPQTYIQNANIDAVRTSVIINRNSMTGSRIRGYIDQGFYDIDEENQLQAVSAIMLQKHGIQKSFSDNDINSKTFCFDIDGVIATITQDNDYNLAKPRQEMIDQINRLHASGHTIILNTARGFLTGIDWEITTIEQLNLWGVNYHKIYFGKPAADFYIDDKMLSMDKVLNL